MKLTVKKIEKLQRGRYCDGDQLYLEVASNTNKNWLLRYERDGKEHWMGLGPLHTFNLSEARERARKARQLLHDGIDPLEDRREKRDEARRLKNENLTFKEAAEKYIALHEDGWRNARHRQQWRNTLTEYAYPTLGPRPVRALDTAVINAALAPIWTTIPETARRTRHRIERVVKWVKDGMPLPAARAATRKVNLAAMPYASIPQFMVRLREKSDIASRALEFTILTAARSGEVLGARWDEIDLDKMLWTIPKERMKRGREHRVPLTERVVEIIEALPRENGNAFVFIGARGGRPLDVHALLKALRELEPTVVVHGFRSTFKDWAAEMTHTPNIVYEAALAHAVGDKTEAAYRRGDMLEKRRHLMAEWAAFCATLPGEKGAVIPLSGRRAAR